MNARLLLLTLLLMVLGGAAVAQTAPVSLLMVGFACPEQDEYLRGLAEQGFNCDRCEFKELTAERLKGFQVVVLADCGQSNNDATPGPELTRVGDVLQQYVQGGGSVFINMYYGQIVTPTFAAILLANRFGGDYNLCELRDPETEVTATAWGIRFGYTDQVPASPVSAGVTGCWVPLTSGGFGVRTPAGGMKLGPEWKPFLYAGKGAGLSPVPWGVPFLDQRTNPKLPGPYCLLAGRDFGKGRVAVTNIPHGLTLSSGTAPALEGIVLDKGLRGKPSDLGKLYVNLYRWLGQPGAALGLGGAPNKFTAPDPATVRKAPPPPPGLVVWDKFQFPTPKRWVGVVGARTTLSGGQGTVAQYCAKAKAAGLNFVGFLEDAAQLTPAELKQLHADCAKESTDTFLAVPGFIIADEFEDHFFVLGTDLTLPDDDLMNPERTKLALRQDKHPDWQMGDVWLDYFYTRLGFKATVGSCLHGTGVPYYDYRDYQAVAITTRQGGKVVDDLTDGYLDLQASGQNVQPYALELMTSPADLDRVLQSGYRVVVMDNDWIHKCTLATHFNTWHCTYASFPQAITSGPEIVQWERMASHDYWADGDRWHAGYYESRIRGALKSEAGLREVRIYDNGRLVRRYDAAGAKEYAVEFGFTREQQHGFVMIAEDVKGGRAITGTYNTQNNQFEEFMCGDRNNQLAYGSGWWPDGTFFKLGNGMSPATPNKGPWNAMIMTCGAYKWDPKVGVGVSTFDGSPETDPLYNVSPGIYPTDEALADRAFHCKANRLLVSADVQVGEGIIDGTFPAGFSPSNVWHSVAPVSPTKLVTGQRRFSLWHTLAGGPVCYVIEGELGVKQPVTLKGQMDVAAVDSRGAQGWSIRNGQGSFVSGIKVPGETKRWQTGPFGSGACLSFYNSSLGACAVVGLDSDLTYLMDTPTASRFWLRYIPADMKLEPGKPVRYRMLVASWPRTTPPTDEVVDQFLQAYGLAGKPPLYKLQVETGKVLDQRFVLTAEAQDGGFAGQVAQCQLPTYIPVMVRGLNPNWSVGYYDRGGKRWRGIGALEGTGYAQIDPNPRAQRFFIGHPVTCDQAALVINCMQTGNGSFQVELHNPTAQALTANLKVSPYMADLVKLAQPQVAVPAGGSVVVK